jgi:hypothetical protein
MPRRTAAASSAAKPLRSPCPIAGALDVMGDADAAGHPRSAFYDAPVRGFLSACRKASRSILAAWLGRLEQCGLVERRRYQERPARDGTSRRAATTCSRRPATDSLGQAARAGRRTTSPGGIRRRCATAHDTAAPNSG